MDGLSLLRAAHALGLAVSVDGDRLVIKGPRSAGPIAKSLLANKVTVMTALNGAAAQGIDTGWPAAARDHFLERLGVADDLGTSVEPGSAAWGIAVAEANRVAAGVPIPAGGLREIRLIDRALSAFAPMGGLKLERLAAREAVGFPEHADAPTGERCPMCRRSLWWATRPEPAMWTCGACHPPVAALGRVYWRDGQDNNTGGLP